MNKKKIKLSPDTDITVFRCIYILLSISLGQSLAHPSPSHRPSIFVAPANPHVAGWRSLQLVRDYIEDWLLQVHQPVAGNYDPLNLGIYTVDNKFEFSVLVDRAVGGAGIEDGEVELMLHRLTIFDDSRGVGEALDETVCVEGLTVRGNYYISINQLGTGSQWPQQLAKKFTHLFF